MAPFPAFMGGKNQLDKLLICYGIDDEMNLMAEK